MPPSRYAAPMFVEVDGQARMLTRVELGRGEEDGQRREAFIQNLIHDHPTLVPMAEIEPAFSPLISVCREMPTPAGFVDNLWITPWGGLVLGEAKLVRNPQARREVVAQALDYARALADWSYEDLQAAVRTALKDPAASLWALVEEATDLDEAQFVDAVERRLRMGQILLLIIGDGITQGVEALTAHLQLHAGLHVGLALLDLSLWRGVDGGLIVVPRVPMKTVLIERGIVRIDDGAKARIDGVGSATAVRPVAKATPFTASETEFMDHLRTKRPELVEPLRAFLADVAQIGVSPEFRKSVVLRFSVGPDLPASAGYIESSGRVWLGDAWSAANRAGVPEVGDLYLMALAGRVGGLVRSYEKSAPQLLGLDGKGLDLAALLSPAAGWKSAIGELRTGLEQAGTSQR